MKKIVLTLPLTLALAACGAAKQSATDVGDAAKDAGVATKAAAEKVVNYVAPDVLPQKLKEASAGNYSLEKNHAFLTTYISHGGLSQYKMDFTDMEAQIVFDPKDASANFISFSVNPLSITTHYPSDYKRGHANSGYESWDEHLAKDGRYLNGVEFPAITFQSTKVSRSGDYKGKVTGDMAFLGVTKPVTFDIEYHGVGNKPWWGERDIIGFSAKATINRNDFGMTKAPKSAGEDVKIYFTGEFLQDSE